MDFIPKKRHKEAKLADRADPRADQDRVVFDLKIAKALA